MRLLLLGALIYLGYRVVKAWALPKKATKRTRGEAGLTDIDDVMVKDPFCGTYFPEKKGIKVVIEGKTHYFCSTTCRDRFLEAASNAKQASSH